MKPISNTNPIEIPQTEIPQTEIPLGPQTQDRNLSALSARIQEQKKSDLELKEHLARYNMLPVTLTRLNSEETSGDKAASDEVTQILYEFPIKSNQEETRSNSRAKSALTRAIEADNKEKKEIALLLAATSISAQKIHGRTVITLSPTKMA